jgi:N-(2-amino-2-carboxyethyl)-L-glutamate synthase
LEHIIMNINELATLTTLEMAAVLRQIGNTPVRTIRLIINGIAREVHIKLEGCNPGGSIKDRTAFSLVRELEMRGVLTPDSVLIDSTSGNLGVALAYIARARGYQFMAVVDPKATAENLAKMRLLGAQLEMVHQADAGGNYLFARLERVRARCESSPRFVWANQYSSLANPRAHYLGTAPELYQQMDGKVDALFAAVSTGGTLAGLGRYFREHSPSTRIIGVDAFGSVVFGGPLAPTQLTGIGSSRQSSFITAHLYDEHQLVTDEVAFAFCRALFAATGIKIGGSSGAVLAACARYLAVHPEVSRAACVSADRGENYETTIYNDAWLTQQGLRLSPDCLGWVTTIAPSTSTQYAASGSGRRDESGRSAA